MFNLDPQSVRDYILESRTGFWKMELRDGAATRMYADDTMQALLGTTPDISPEACYTFFADHIHPDDLSLIKACQAAVNLTSA